MREAPSESTVDDFNLKLPFSVCLFLFWGFVCVYVHVRVCVCEMDCMNDTSKICIFKYLVYDYACDEPSN